MSSKTLIFAHVFNLKEKKNARRKLYFVQDDNTEEQQAKRQLYRDLFQEEKLKPNEEDRLKVKMFKSNIMVNNEIVKQKVDTPRVADILCMTDDELQDIKATKLQNTGTHLEKGSEFVAYVANVKSVAEVQCAYTKVKIKMADASHVVCAYRLKDADSYKNQVGVHDNEFGAGNKMLQVFKDKEVVGVAIFVARHASKAKLGPHRFEIYEDLAKQAVAKLQQKRHPNRQRVNSQSSLASIASALSMGEESQDETGSSSYSIIACSLQDLTDIRFIISAFLVPGDRCWHMNVLTQ